MAEPIITRILLILSLWFCLALAGVVSVLWMGRISPRAVASCSNLKQLDEALTEYSVKNGAYPAQLPDLYPEFVKDYRLFLNPLKHAALTQKDNSTICWIVAPILGLLGAIWIWRAGEPSAQTWMVLLISIAVLIAAHQVSSKMRAVSPMTVEYEFAKPSRPGIRPTITNIPGSQAPYGDHTIFNGILTITPPQPTDGPP